MSVLYEVLRVHRKAYAESADAPSTGWDHHGGGGHSFKTFHKNSDDEEGFFEKV